MLDFEGPPDSAFVFFLSIFRFLWNLEKIDVFLTFTKSVMSFKDMYYEVRTQTYVVIMSAAIRIKF